jgi:hypothetical protein
VSAGIVREAFVLPVVFLTVALLGGFRVTEAGDVAFLSPPLATLPLGALLLTVLAASGVLRPHLLMNGGRSTTANLSGALVLASLFVAGTQVFNLVTPEEGLLNFLCTAFFVILLFNTLAARPDRQRQLHSLLVVFGGAFSVKFILLEALYDPDGSFATRVVTAMLGGVTRGGLSYAPHGEPTGYVAFFTIALYMTGLWLLRPGAGTGRLPLLEE